MKQILVLGAGRSAGFLVRRLLELAGSEDWFVTVGDLDPDASERLIEGHPRGAAIRFDVNDASLRASRISQADVVVNMLSPAFQHIVAWDCLSHGTHMLSVSYRDEAVRALDGDAQRQGVLLLSELGLDPGIDHMSAMALLDRVRGEGGRVRAFRSYGAGIPAPSQSLNPLGYWVTWNPRNVVMAGESGAQFKMGGRLKLVPQHRVFRHAWPVDVEGVGRLEAYPNRDAISYGAIFGLEDADTILRATMRWPGWCETWDAVVRLGLPTETLRVPDLGRRSPADVVEMLLPDTGWGGAGADDGSLEARVARLAGVPAEGAVMRNLRFLGLFDSAPLDCPGRTPAEMMTHLLATHLTMPETGRDMVVLRHELDVEARGARQRIVSTLVAEGDARSTAMARTVGLPTALAVRLVLRGELTLTGSLIPTHPAIYEPVLAALADEGLRFEETRGAPGPSAEPATAGSP
ncbi:MAG: saccharopine dehydrogenase C-terminal domain-containing protein [Gemmatimonadota bacterium]|nr:saccharopine dehydrogenase C-terminal domain-containing protein [Gemmatimonadota bacterium]